MTETVNINTESNQIKEMDPQMALCLERAQYYLTHRFDIINRLFVGCPEKTDVFNAETGKNITVTLKTDRYSRIDIAGILKNLKANNAEHARIFFKFVKEKIANTYYKEVIEKKIPQLIFEEGAMSFGFCDTIAYFGKYYLAACDTLGREHKIEKIDHLKIKIKYFVDCIDDIIAGKKNILKDGVMNTCIMYSGEIANWPEGAAPGFVVIDLNMYPCPIIGAIADYEGITAIWRLDTVALHKASQYYKRPRNIAEIKVKKELYKMYYGSALLGLGNIEDGGDDDVLADNIDVDVIDAEATQNIITYDPIAEKQNLAQERLKSLAADFNKP